MVAAFRDPDAPIETRLDDLLEQMTLDEKIGQLIQVSGWSAVERVGAAKQVVDPFATLLAQPGIGALYGINRADSWTGVTRATGWTTTESAEVANLLQAYVRDRTRLGIPLLMGNDGSHGALSLDATVFPVGIALASTWNPSLGRAVGAAIARELRAQGVQSLMAPVLDVARDPRWGRLEETFGEDPRLVGAVGVAMVQGLQGERLDGPDAVVATIKHFAAHGEPEGGHNSAPAHVGLRELHDVWLPPFKAAIAAGAQSVMAAYHELDGIPCSVHADLLTSVLRDQWGFDGFVISDMEAIPILVSDHHVAIDLEEAACQALEAGLDMELGMFPTGAAYLPAVRHGVLSGRLPLATLDQAVRRILRVKFRLGLFEQPFVQPGPAAEVVGQASHRVLARQVASQSLVLLKNADSLLPLAPDMASIAVIGPLADASDDQLGSYTAPQDRQAVVTVLDGIRAAVALTTTITTARGCDIRQPDTRGFAEAVELARAARVALVVVGGSSTQSDVTEAEASRTGAAIVQADAEMDSGEGYDRASLDLSGVQAALVQAVHSTGTPVVVIHIGGRPISNVWMADHVPAILEAWYPGIEGGHAIADILFGRINPSGRLPISIPRDVGQLPVFYNAKPTARKPTVEGTADPLYPFGYGLNYTSFAYANLRVTPESIPVDGQAQVIVDVTNTGTRIGEDVVQLYVRDEISSVTRPVKELLGFTRVQLAPGQTQTVVIEVAANALALWNRQMRQVVEPGTFTLWIGTAQQVHGTTTLQVTA